MLNGKLVLHDIRDVEQFTGRIIDRARLELSPQDNEDLWAYLIATAWELSRTYDRGDPRFPPLFSVFATNVLECRVVDWQRRRNGRTVWQFSGHTYEREIPSFLEYDDTTVVGTTEMDLGERLSPGGERVDGNGSISPSAYFPPRSLYLFDGARRPPDNEANRKDREREAA